MGRPKSLTYPAPSPGASPRKESRTYDAAGRLLTYTNRDDKVKTFSYDNLHRQTGFTWSAGSAPNVSFLYDAANRMTAINTIDATISRTYFDDNLLQTETETPTGGSANTVTYAWNADANRESILYPSGAKYKYYYTGRNQLKQVRDATSLLYQAEYAYDVNGSVATRKVGVNVGFSSVTTDASQRDALGKCTHLVHQFPAGSGGPRTFDYVFDAMSNRTSIQRDGGSSDIYGYDLAEQVTTGVDGVPRTYGYDANGNRTTLDGVGNFATNNLNQQTTFNGFSVSYDNNGNAVSSVFSSLSNCLYDAQNRLTSVTYVTTQTTFKYDGLNRKISQTTGGVTTYNVWDGWNLIEERGAGNTLLNSYVYGAGEIIERISNAGTYFYYQDGLGSTSHLADATGALQESYKYNTFGWPIVCAPDGTIRKGGSTKDVRHLFTGQLWIPTAALYDYRNRVFSPTLTRFLQPDPAGFAGDPSNLYRYCGNNAVNSGDPSGLGTAVGDDGAAIIKPEEGVTDRVTVNGHYDFDNNENGFREVTDRNGGLGALNQGGGRSGGGFGGGRRIFRNSNGPGRSHASPGIGPSAPRSTQGYWRQQDGLPTPGLDLIVPVLIGDAEISAALMEAAEIVSDLLNDGRVPQTPQEILNYFLALDGRFHDVETRDRTFSYTGGFAPSGEYKGWEINYIVEGEGFAALGLSEEAMRDGIQAWRSYQRYPEGVTQGILIWAHVGWSFGNH